MSDQAGFLGIVEIEKMLAMRPPSAAPSIAVDVEQIVADHLARREKAISRLISLGLSEEEAAALID